MRIAIISRYLPSTSKMGTGYQAHYLANGLVGLGHSVTVFSTCPQPEDALYDFCAVAENPPFRSLRLSWSLRHVDWAHFDVLHAHGDDWFLWGRKFPPHVRTMHGSCFAEAFHIPGIKSKCYMLWLSALETMSVFVADVTVGVSANTCKSYPWIKRVIPNGVDVAAFRPTQKAPCPTILFVGTYHNRKRGRWLMEIFNESVLPRVPDAKLWMVCSDAPAAPGVEVLGKLSNEELADRYGRAWVFCLPSTYEGFGVPYIEALASGTAVVATPNVGAREILANGKWGVLAPDSVLASNLIEILESEKLRHGLARAGRERALEFSWESVIDRYEQLYEQVRRGH